MDYRISGERLKGFADQARRLGKVGGELTPAQAEEVLAGVTGGGVSLFDTTVTDKIANHIVAPVVCTWEAEVEEYPAKKYSYNGVVLPEILPISMDGYPYAFIRDNNISGHYDLFLSSTAFFLSDADTITGAKNKPWWRIEKAKADTAQSWEYYKESTAGLGVAADRTVLWSNHDIPNGSADATEIYFEGSEPVLAE